MQIQFGIGHRYRRPNYGYGNPYGYNNYGYNNYGYNNGFGYGYGMPYYF
jgi:hypothetical protein